MKRWIAYGAALTLTAGLVAGCDGAAEQPDARSDGAEAEVLEGSISDAMIPLDQVRSQAPRAVIDDEDTATQDAAEDTPEATPEDGEGD